MKWPERSPLWYDVAIWIVLMIAIVLIWKAPTPQIPHISSPARPVPAFAYLPTSNPIPNVLDLTARPLFAQTRRPPPVRPPQRMISAVLPKPIPTTTGLVLLGVLHAGRKEIALVVMSGNPYPITVRRGDFLGAWKVMKILDDHLVLQSGRMTADLALPRPQPTLAPTPPFQNTVIVPQTVRPYLRNR